MTELISLIGLNKAKVLAALYDAAKPQGLGFLHFDPAPMTLEEARTLLIDSPDGYFDYVQGRVMKVDLSGDTLRTVLYDRDNGLGKAKAVIDSLRE